VLGGAVPLATTSRPLIFVCAALLFGAVIAACGGGGGGGSSPIPLGPNPSPSASAPASSGSARILVIVPPASQQETPQSLTIALAGTGTHTPAPLVTVNLTAKASGCVSASGELQCTAAVTVPIAKDNFQITTYSAANATGTVLWTGQTGGVTIEANASKPAMTLDTAGVPATVTLALGTSELPVGYAGSTTIVVQAKDSSGDLIIGGTFSPAITLTKSGDTYDTVTLSATSVTSPGQVVTLSYNGNSNVGTTITPSGTGITGTAATFSATGSVLTDYQISGGLDLGIFYPYDVAAMTNGTAAIVGEFTACDCSIWGIALVSASAGQQQIFTGTTTDPFATSSPPPGYTGTYSPPPTPTPPPAVPGTILVSGMSATIDTDELGGLYDDVAASGTTVYYSGTIESYNATSTKYGTPYGCYGNSLATGTLGVLNTAAQTTVEYPLLGYPGSIKVDASGNAWWVETTGNCAGTNLLGSDYFAIGFLPAGGGTPTETVLSSVIPDAASASPTDMALASGSNGDTYMYLADEGNETVWQIPISASGSTPSFGTPIDQKPSSTSPFSVAAATDGTTYGTSAWFNDATTTGNFNTGDYSFDYIPGGEAFSQSLLNAVFPIQQFVGCSMTYADGSFWSAQANATGCSGYEGEFQVVGVARVSGLANSAPVDGYYPVPGTSETLSSISAAGGYVWSTDYEYGNINVMQYGAPSTGTITYSAIHRPVNYVARRNPHPNPRFVNPYRKGSRP